VFENLGTTISLTYDPKGSSTGGGLFDRKTGANESIVAGTSFSGPSTTLSGRELTLTTTLKSVTNSITVDALIQNNKAHVLASPSIATLNGKEARIIIGERFPIVTTTQTETGTTESTEFVDVGTTLTVTPLVSPDGWITMNVHPEVSSVSASLAAGPRITTREADATIRVKDKQTIIIGGLINKKDDKNEGGVPGLKDIPVIGKLFSRRSSDVEETELTVFITPHIIKSGEMVSVDDEGGLAREISLDIQRVGDLNLVAKLIEHAKSLEIYDSPESLHKTLSDRKVGMLNAYKMIVSQFPNSQEADFALFRMGELYYDFRRYPEASNAFEELIKKYPNSDYKKRSKDYLKKAAEGLLLRKKLIADELSMIEEND